MKMYMLYSMKLTEAISMVLFIPFFIHIFMSDPKWANIFGRKKANDGPLTNFEVLNFLQSRGASKEVAVTVTPSEYKVFEYLLETPAGSQTRESVTEFAEKVKKYDLAKAEIFNIIDTRPILPVIFAIVDQCDKRLRFDGAEKILELVTTIFPAPPEEAEQPQDEDADAGDDAAAEPADAAAEPADGGGDEDQ